ncbi:hypothetical protein [Frondihabitans cladoniiphilus]|uniref:FMN-binding domain-containing protein n=1 Tax=Frondihabitans cladoniiphilus TaxID=715785 RepID=A0ABP8W051_9MICO
MPITRNRTVIRTTLLAAAGLSAVGVLSGCSTAASTPAQGSSDSGSTSRASSSSASSSPTSDASSGATSASDDNGASSSAAAGSGSGTYKNGTYTEQGTYSSPGGQELISVQLAIHDDAVQAVTVKTVKADPTATSYEAKFIGGISSAIVGKKIDDLHVTNVAGSSLTSQGFDDALTKIKSDAADD